MAEYEVDVELEGKTDIEIDFGAYNSGDKLNLIKRILRGEKVTFEDIHVVLNGETTVEIEPRDRY